MKSASVKEIKTALDGLSRTELLQLCSRLIKFKKDNKELVTYILFEETDESTYVNNAKKEIDILFIELNTKNLYIARKNLRRILKFTNKFIKYSTVKTTEVILLIYFCGKINSSGLNIRKSTALTNLYQSQIKKIVSAIDKLHEDLQYDYNKELALLQQLS